jgi:hypothetical protein
MSIFNSWESLHINYIAIKEFLKHSELNIYIHKANYFYILLIVLAAAEHGILVS